MNKLTKVGLSALCGSLTAVSAANAGDMTVTGGVDMTWITGADYATGNPIGMGSNLTFKGTGELDNGWEFKYTVAMLNGDDYSNSVVNITMGSFGDININQGDSGNGIDAYDDKMPTAWEEPWGGALGTGVHLVRGVGPEFNIQYKTPTIAGITIAVATAPDMGGGNTADKGTSGGGGTVDAGYDATVNVNPSFGLEILSGLNMFVGAHYAENTLETMNNKYEAVGGATLDLGPISIGYATSGVAPGNDAASEVDYYKNHMYGIAFNINDDLSVSYGYHESQKGFVGTGAGEQSIYMDMESYQIAYTVGGASLRYAQTQVNNAAYQEAGSYDKENSVISVSLAF